MGKHTDSLAQELVASTEGKTSCKEWGTDSWQGYGRVLPLEVDHYISKLLTQRLERTNGILRQQTGRWHRRQNKFAKVWEQTKVTLRLIMALSRDPCKNRQDGLETPAPSKFHLFILLQSFQKS